MITNLNFSHMQMPQYLRDQVGDLIEKQLADLNDLIKLDLFFNKQSSHSKSPQTKFKCYMGLQIYGIRKRFKVSESGEDCWNLLNKCLRKIRHQVLTNKRKFLSARNQKLPTGKSSMQTPLQELSAS
ncbi:MAG: hypothetical protein K1X29_05190 [Bdellovibrionales bacterium]|nr:hypothetical protein [Bdellovibrionales bacterium]